MSSVIKPRSLLRPGPDVAAAIDVRGLENDLRARIRGEVRFDAGSKALYATDASNYRQVPIGVVIPRDQEDVVEAVRLCSAYGAPLLSRGGGTSLAGQCCNVAVVMDFTKYMNRIIAIDPDRRLARVEPGCVRDHLCKKTQAEYDLTYGPDPATHDHCTFGGMIGNNACGIHALMAGKTEANVHALEVLTYDGLRMTVGATAEDEIDRIVARGGRRGRIYADMRDLRDRCAELIRARYPEIPRRVSGYNLDELLPENGFHVARALVGTEGTCVTYLEATVRLVPWPRGRTLLVLGYPSVYEAADHVPEILESEPIGLEALDDILVANIRAKGQHAQDLELLPAGGGWLLVEFGGRDRAESSGKAHALMARLRRQPGAPSMKLYTDRDEEDEVWQVRESGLGSTARVPGRPDTWPGWEDSAVAPEKLGGYLRDLRRLFTRYGYRPSLYGHFGQGCVHCRVDFDVVTSEGVAKFRSFLREAAELCAGYGGSLSGEHGDGQARAEFLPIMYGEELVAAFRAFKAIWDPKGKMNPGKVVDPDPVDANLRLGPDYAPAEPATRFAFADDDGSFERATLRCVGIGKCRRAEGGVMCPSYMVTGEEMHSTRGRAHLLHEMLRGDPLGGGWRDEHVKEALELCLACKGCKSDCPINVDMATYKAEFLSHYYEGRLRPRPAYAMGLIHWWARLAALAPGVANFVTQTPGVSAVAKLLAGAHPKRRIPAFARETFRAWFRRRPAKNIRGPKVILWPDTFNDHFHPETARAAVEVLEAAGFRVLVPPAPLCCGRPLYDYGFVDIAKRLLVRTIEALRPEIAAGTPLVGLEPSCLAVFRDEMTGLLPHDRDAARLRRQSFTLAELLTKRAAGFEPPRLARRAIVQTHCHQHAIMKFDADREILRKMGLDFEVLDSGCCGMAGSFGYERGKYDVSMACGERVLLPRVRAAEKDVLVLADGFSCREQIAEGTDRRALHLSLVLQMALKEGSGGPPGPYPEHGYVTTQPALGSPAAARRRAMAAGAAGLAAAVAIAAMARARRA